MLKVAIRTVPEPKWDFWLFPTSTKETSQASFKLRASKAPELAYQESEGGSG